MCFYAPYKVDGLAYKKVHQPSAPNTKPQSSTANFSPPPIHRAPSPPTNNKNQVDSINIMNIELKPTRLASLSSSSMCVKASGAPTNPISPTTAPHKTGFGQLYKETNLPVIAVETPSNLVRNRTDLVSFCRSFETRRNLSLNAQCEEPVNVKSTSVRNVGNDVRTIKKAEIKLIKEPKLFEFKHIQAVPATRTPPNKQFLVKRASLPYHHLINISKSRFNGAF